MPTFTYEAINKEGKKLKSEVEAVSQAEAVAKINHQGYKPISVKERAEHSADRSLDKTKKKGGSAGGAAKSAGRHRGFNISFGRVKTKTLTQFTRQLSVLQDAGLPILRSLKILEAQQKAGLLKNILADVAADVEGGSTLSEAMAKQPRAFDRLYTNMISAGEAGGVLETILQRLADFMEKSERLKRKVIGALIYPAVVIGFAVLIVTGIMIVVIPKFKEIFADFKTGLPTPTLILLGMSDWFMGKGMPFPFFGAVIVLFLPVVLVIALKLIRKSAGGRYFLDRVTIKIPIFGNILARTTIARFARTLGTLLNAGVPILEAITITKDTCGNEVYSRALAKCHDAIREGESFAAPLRETRVVDPIVVNMVDVGEETGEIDKMLIKIADTYDDEVETLVASLVSLLEPVMVVALGLVVGGIVIALFMPLVTLISSVSGGGK